MHRPATGFTLIELIVVFAIIGVLASLAVSSYQTYVVRAQVSEGLTLARNVEMPVEAAYRSDATAPADRVAAGLTPEPAHSGGAHVRLLDITSGRIDLTFGGPRTHADIVGDTLSLTPYLTDGDTIAWRCGNAAAPPGGRLLTGGAEHRESSVEPRYLPKNCR